MGTWVAYELLRAVHEAGLPLPIKVFLSGKQLGEGSAGRARKQSAQHDRSSRCHACSMMGLPPFLPSYVAQLYCSHGITRYPLGPAAVAAAAGVG